MWQSHQPSYQAESGPAQGLQTSAYPTGNLSCLVPPEVSSQHPSVVSQLTSNPFLAPWLGGGPAPTRRGANLEGDRSQIPSVDLSLWSSLVGEKLERAWPSKMQS
ncbi:hypothetical protein FKM82_023322 [Ascaphus truei]